MPHVLPHVLPNIAPERLRSGKSRAELSTRPAPGRFARPDWTVVTHLGLIALMFAAVLTGLVFTRHLELGPVMYGLLLR